LVDWIVTLTGNVAANRFRAHEAALARHDDTITLLIFLVTTMVVVLPTSVIGNSETSWSVIAMFGRTYWAPIAGLFQVDITFWLSNVKTPAFTVPVVS